MAIKFIRNFLNLTLIIIKVLIYGMPYYIIKLHLYKHTIPNYHKYDATLVKLGRTLTSLLEASGPSFIKLGQILSTRPDLVGELITLELSKLRDKLPPFDFNIVISDLNLGILFLFAFSSLGVYGIIVSG